MRLRLMARSLENRRLYESETREVQAIPAPMAARQEVRGEVTKKWCVHHFGHWHVAAFVGVRSLVFILVMGTIKGLSCSTSKTFGRPADQKRSKHNY
jgi:hypothetical protein